MSTVQTAEILVGQLQVPFQKTGQGTMLVQSLLLPVLASCVTAVRVSVAQSGGNVTTNLQYGAMEEVIHSVTSTFGLVKKILMSSTS